MEETDSHGDAKEQVPTNNDNKELPAPAATDDQDISGRAASLLGLHDSDDDYKDDANISLVSYRSADELIGAHIAIPDITTIHNLHCVTTDTVEHEHLHANSTSDDKKLHTCDIGDSNMSSY